MKLRKVLCFMLLILCISLGVSLTMKANIGIGAYDAVSQRISALSLIPVGTVMMCSNLLCVFAELLILKKNFKFKHVLQIVLSILLGYLINFFYYDLLGNLVVDNYFLRLILLIVGYTINAFVVAGIMLLDIVTFPLEGVCKAISDQFHIDFSKLRQVADILSVCIVLILWFIFDIELYVREGTVIGMLLFGPLIGIFMKILNPLLKKL